MVFVEGARTPFLSALTEFQTMMPHQLLAQAMSGLLARAGVQGNNDKLLLLSYLTAKYKISKPSFLVPASAVDHVVAGTVNQEVSAGDSS